MTNNNDNYDNVFSYRHFLDALKKCNKGVSYKGSVQLYDILCLERIEKSKRFLDKCQLPPIGNMEQVVIRERGKQRIITPVKISDRMVRKLKKYKNLVKDNLMTKDDVFASVQSWLGYIKIANSYRVRRRIIALYSKLFGGYRITNEWSRKRGVKTNNELLQNNK